MQTNQYGLPCSDSKVSLGISILGERRLLIMGCKITCACFNRNKNLLWTQKQARVERRLRENTWVPFAPGCARREDLNQLGTGCADA